jgi:hypothetical protein
VISADGKHHNPDYEALQWIVEEAEKQGRQIELIITNETESTRKLTEEYDVEEYGYTLNFLPTDKLSLKI